MDAAKKHGTLEALEAVWMGGNLGGTFAASNVRPNLVERPSTLRITLLLGELLKLEEIVENVGGGHGSSMAARFRISGAFRRSLQLDSQALVLPTAALAARRSKREVLESILDPGYARLVLRPSEFDIGSLDAGHVWGGN